MEEAIIKGYFGVIALLDFRQFCLEMVTGPVATQVHSEGDVSLITKTRKTESGSKEESKYTLCHHSLAFGMLTTSLIQFISELLDMRSGLILNIVRKLSG